MASSYKGVDLFGSGPHRFGVRARGVETVARWRVTGNSAHGGTLPIGQVELEVVVTGRLVAGSEEDLWELREAVAGAASFSAGSGVLIDHEGREFDDMWFIEYAESERVDRGRLWSIGYTARFRDFSSL